MLEQVSMGQSRFMTPGVAPDSRGVLLGRYGLIQFSTLEGVVSWLRLYSAEASLDELLTGMQILRVRTPLQSRELLLRIPATSSYVMDSAARCASLVGGTSFTGTGKHFVKYRDERSPYGYDAADISSLPDGTQLMLHSDDFSQSYSKEGELSFEKLLFRLSLKREQGRERLLDEELQKGMLLVVERGLGEGVIRYLWRNQVDAQVGMVRPQQQSAFDELGRSSEFLLLRVSHLPERIFDLFEATPGIEVFRAVGTNVAVQLGYAHVVDLASCASVFDPGRFYIFWGKGDRVDVVAGPLQLSAIEHLTHLDVDIEGPDQRANLELEEANPVSVSMRLAHSMKPPSKVAGTLVPPEQAAWVKRLVYLLPPSILRGHRIAVTDRGILLVAEVEIDVVPLGQLLVQVAPGLLIPAGMDLVPRVAPEVLAATLGHGAGILTVFPPSGTPFQVKESALVPLERRAIAKIDVEEVTTIDMSRHELGDPSVVNDPVGRFALWGFQNPEGS